MTQLRLRRNDEALPAEAELRELHEREGLIFDDRGRAVPPKALRIKGNVLSFTVDLDSTATIGYRARHYVSELLDLTAVAGHDAGRFWAPLPRPPERELILEPNSFYILTARERVRIPPGYAAEIAPYDPSTGELRSHYAGFFDPGFGYGEHGEAKGNVVVLEVRAHGAPFRLTDGQVICKMLFERMTDVPEKLYGQGIGSTYTNAGIRLSKFFKQPSL
jgi:dCTP deaminase